MAEENKVGRKLQMKIAAALQIEGVPEEDLPGKILEKYSVALATARATVMRALQVSKIINSPNFNGLLETMKLRRIMTGCANLEEIEVDPQLIGLVARAVFEGEDKSQIILAIAQLMDMWKVKAQKLRVKLGREVSPDHDSSNVEQIKAILDEYSLTDRANQEIILGVLMGTGWLQGEFELPEMEAAEA